MSVSDSIAFRDRNYSVSDISNKDDPNLIPKKLNANITDDDVDTEVDLWLLKKRKSIRLERRPTAVFDMEKSAAQASIQLKLQQERRRMKHKERIKLRLETREYNDLLASSENEEVNLESHDVLVTSSEEEGIQQRGTNESSIIKGDSYINEENNNVRVKKGVRPAVRAHNLKNAKLRRKLKSKSSRARTKELVTSSIATPDIKIGVKKQVRSKKFKKRI